MADRTAARRVKKYREIQRESRGIRRIGVQVPSLVPEDVKGLGRRLQDAFKKAAAAEKPIRSVLATINAPRPYPISAAELVHRSEEHTSELQSLMRISYAVLCLKKNTITTNNTTQKKTK